jgi:mono/diheme cytochrome c family protein
VKTGAALGDWSYTTYRWSADGETTATKLDTGETDVNGTSYEIPAHGQCLQCHGGRPDMLLGIDAINLGTAGAVGLSLSSLIAAKAFTTDPPASIEIPEDETGHARATFGWLHTNCGIPCHNSNSGALAEGTGLFLKTSAAQLIAGGGATPLTEITPYVTAVNVVPKMTQFASQGFLRIYPGNPALSLIPTLDAARNNPNIPQMPPIISHIEDTTDVTKMTTWISTMPIPDAGPQDAGSTDAAEADAGD